MSKNTRDFDARNRDRRQALEKKKVIAVGLLGPRPRAAAVEVVPANKEIGNCTPLAAPETVLRYASRGSLLSVFSSHTGAPLTLSDGLLDVVNLYLDVAHSKKAAFGLLWPGVLTNLPLTHALATTSRWMEGYKNGLRGLLFPSKANTFYVLDHLYFDADQLLRLADVFLEPVGRDVNPRVRQSLRDKDPFLFFLGTLRKAVQGRELRPCINELLPHFDVGEVELNLRNYGGEFFEHLIGRIRDRSYKKALTSTFESIGDPRRAPDALFALTYKVSAASYREKLRLIEKCGQQDVVLVDATRRGR